MYGMHFRSRSDIKHVCDVIEKNVYGAKGNKEVIDKEVVDGKLKKSKEVLYYPGREINYSGDPIDNVYISIVDLCSHLVTISVHLDPIPKTDENYWKLDVSKEIYYRVRDELKTLFGMNEKIREYRYDEKYYTMSKGELVHKKEDIY